MPAQIDTRACVDRAAQGDAQAVEALLGHYAPGLRAYVRLNAGGVVLAQEESMDIVQSACREVLEHIEKFRYSGEGAFKHWLYTTAIRKIRDKHKFYRADKRDVLRNKPAQEASQSADTPGDAAQLLASYGTLSTPSGRVATREEIARIEGAFAALSEEHREVILLARIVGLSHAEIAERTNKSEGATRMLLHRALARLAGLLDTAS